MQHYVAASISEIARNLTLLLIHKSIEILVLTFFKNTHFSPH